MEHLEDKRRGPRRPESQVARVMSVTQERAARIASVATWTPGKESGSHGANAKN